MSDAPLTDGKQAPEECALVGILYMCVCVKSTGKERSEETEESSERYAVKRGSPFCTGQLRTGFLSYVYRFVSTVQV